MDGNDFGEWLLQQMERLEWKQADLARASNVTTATVSRWVTGERVPSYSYAQRIAAALGVAEDLVLRQAGLKPQYDLAPPPRSIREEAERFLRQLPRGIPHHSQLISAGKGEALIDGYIYIDVDDRHRPNLFAADVTGTCMDPIVSPGDTVVVDPDELPEPGKMVVAVIDDEQVVVKRYVIEGKRRWLRPLNGEQIAIDEHVRILGVVKKIIKAA